MRRRFLQFAAGLALLPGLAAAGGFLEREVAFSEAQVQAAIDKSGSLERNYGGFVSISLQQPPRIALGTPAGLVTLTGAMQLTFAGQPAIPVDVTGTAGVRYDDRAKAFFLENPVATSVHSPALQKEAEPMVRQTVTRLMATYFRSRPVHVLRDNGSNEEIAARLWLRAIRIEPGRVVATLSPG
ncbi:DUF1439 domain-containing protein [Azonexus sp.]|uniref:DUF1439 domain-containing protein n=1 Tax=Azonexus sp. TaxID=1872668 RepID=UPI0035AE4827